MVVNPPAPVKSPPFTALQGAGGHLRTQILVTYGWGGVGWGGGVAVGKCEVGGGWGGVGRRPGVRGDGFGGSWGLGRGGADGAFSSLPQSKDKTYICHI